MATLLSINNYYYPRGGAETVFLTQNRLLEGIGWEVIPFSMRHPSNLSTPWDIYFVEEIEYGAAYSLIEKISRVPKVIYSGEARRKIDCLLDKTQPHIAHAHNIYHHISPSIFGVIKRREIPSVMTLHDLKILCPAYNMLSQGGICEKCRDGREYNVVLHRCIKQSWPLSTVVFMEAMLHKVLGTYSKYVDRFVVPSKFYLEKMVEWGWPRDRFTHIPNFIHVPEYMPDFNAYERFVYFGRLSREKGLSTLIRAAAQARVPLDVVGAGPDEEALQELAQGLAADVKFHGYMKGKALHDIIRTSRSLVLASEWYENAPMSILEAYALGKPVIGANIGGIPELIQQSVTGLIFESGSVDSLATVLRTMADMPTYRVSDMGRAGREWIEHQFSSDAYKEKLLELYASLGVSGKPSVANRR